MKRKSEQITPNVVRNFKKHKTVGGPKRKPVTNSWESFCISQMISTKIIQQIIEAAESRIKILANEQLVDSIVNSCQLMASNLAHLISPQLYEVQNCQTVVGKQPERSMYDPICGFDKLITIKGDVTKTQETELSQTKSKMFGLLQASKKRPSFSKCINNLSSLIPLDDLNGINSKTTSQKQNQKCASYFRDRIYDSGLPILAPENRKSEKSDKGKPTKFGIQVLKQNTHEDCVFDYNGQKSLISSSAFPKIGSSSFRKTSSNVLKTIYRVIDHISDDNKKPTISKHLTSRISNIQGIKQVIKNPNIKNQSIQIKNNVNQILKFTNGQDGTQAIKNFLQTSFKQKQIAFKSIQRTTRLSKLV